MRNSLFALIGFVFLLAPYGIAQENTLNGFVNLVGETWISEGEQLGGHQGKTEKVFEWGLNGKMVKVKTFATDPQTLEYGLRNEGVRVWNTQEEKIVFYEFDIKGGITTGEVNCSENNVYYDYAYEGMQLRDAWDYVNDSTYNYTVGVWNGEEWEKIFYQTIFRKK